MNNTIDTKWLDDPTDLHLRSEVTDESLEPVTTNAAIAARAAYLAYDEGVLEEAPEALAAYLANQMQLDV